MKNTGKVFRVPLVLGVLSVVGLVSALLADGVWDLVSWCALGAPLLAVVWALRYRRVTLPARHENR